MNYVTYAIPVFVLMMAMEFLWGRYSGRQTYRLNDTINSLSMGLLSRVVDLLRLGFAGVVLGGLVSLLGVTPIATDSAWVWVIAFIAYDCCYYWKHRFGHEWRILWASHVAHHQSEEFNLSTALRQTGTDYIGFVFYLPLYVAGVPVEVVVTVGSLNLIYQFWVHTEHVRRLGPLEWILVTPSNHRVHHARNPEYIDRNYGGVFILWDRLFGTFKDEQEEIPCYYGITHALHSWNPIWANLHMWVETAQLAWRTQSWRDKLLIWFKPPSWIPADIEAESHNWRQPKYDPAISNLTRYYCFAQYWLLTAFGLAAVLSNDALPYSLAVTLFALVAFSFYCHGRMLEGREHAARLEALRLASLSGLALLAPLIWSIVTQSMALIMLGYCVFCALVLWLGLRSGSLNRHTHSVADELNQGFVDYKGALQ